MVRLIKIALVAAVVTAAVFGILIARESSGSGEPVPLKVAIQNIFGLLLLLAPFALFLFIGRFARSTAVKTTVGLLMALLMVGFLVVATIGAGIGSATSGSQKGYDGVMIIAFVFVIILAAYGLLCSAKPRSSNKENSSGETSSPGSLSE
jgi:hypothetical protein